ncbi:MAG: nucleotidyltransferase domain-containing protein [Planctomycetaceae bacterium]|jgi:predicted nucleotidyltransferase|nr:nucleotidyltransferase domain-containing protein [Planctomycetaceae bacterium]
MTPDVPEKLNGISEKDLAVILSVFRKYSEVERAVLFGSRATGKHKPASDADFALEGQNITFRTLCRLAADFDESPLPYRVDLVLLNSSVAPELLEQIHRYGINLSF